MKVLELQSLNYIFPNKYWALRNINFYLKKGELSILSGESGSGKSTLIKIMRGLHSDIGGELEGKIKINGIDSEKLTSSELGSHIGIVFQNPSYQLHQPRVIDEIMSAPIYQGIPWDECYEKALNAAQGLVDPSLFSLNPNNLSLGQQQRVAIAASLSLDANIILFDEPFSYFDDLGIEELKIIFKKLLSEGKTILVATHDFEPIIKIASSLIIINKGEIEKFDTPQNVIYSNSNIKFINESLVFKIVKEINKNIKYSDRPICWDDICKMKNIENDSKLSLKFNESTNKNQILSVKNLSYKYPNGTQALLNVNLEANQGEVIGLLGPNGSGKSTLIKLILGFIKSRDGEINVSGENVKSPCHTINHIGYISQNPSETIFETTVFKECAFGPKAIGLNNIDERVLTELSIVGIDKYIDRDPRSLSGGEQRLLNIASTNVNDPDIIVFDEPEFGLDFFRLNLVENIIRRLSMEGKTIIVVTHKFELAAFLCSRITYLYKGQVLINGRIEELIGNQKFLVEIGFEHSFLKCLIWTIEKLGYFPTREEFISVISNDNL